MAVDQSQQPAEEPTELNATRARGGSWGRHILWVLVISLVLAAIALFASFAIKSPDGADGPGGQVQSQDAPAFEAPQQQPVENPTASPSGTR